MTRFFFDIFDEKNEYQGTFSHELLNPREKDLRVQMSLLLRGVKDFSNMRVIRQESREWLAIMFPATYSDPSSLPLATQPVNISPFR